MKANFKFQRKIGQWQAILVLVVVMGLLASGCGGTQKPKVYHVGILGVPSFPEATLGFKAELTELGYVEGKNIVYDAHDYDPATAKGILQKFVADKVDLIFAYSTASALDAKAATQGTNIPVVFALATLEGSSLVDEEYKTALFTSTLWKKNTMYKKGDLVKKAYYDGTAGYDHFI